MCIYITKFMLKKAVWNHLRHTNAIRLQPVLELLLGHDVGVLVLEDPGHAVGVVREASRAPLHHVSPHCLVQRKVWMLGEGQGGSGVVQIRDLSFIASVVLLLCSFWFVRYWEVFFWYKNVLSRTEGFIWIPLIIGSVEIYGVTYAWFTTAQKHSIFL